MPFKFNPFTGNFDQTGSGGGGSSYIDGEVAAYGDLSLDAGVAPLNSAWLVREASGTWLLGRKPAGIYIRTATAGVSRDADYTYAGILPDVFSDANFLLYDNGDSTKNLQFQLSGITTGTTRTLTVPNSSGTISLTGHTHIASDIIFGQFANNRINWASPDPIGSSVPQSGSFTTLNATGTTELVNGGTTAGPFRLYNISSAANANFERLSLRWASNVAIIGTEKLGTGSARALEFQTDGVTRMTIAATGAVSTAGNLTVGGSTVAFYYPGGLWAGVNGAFAVAGTLSLNNSLNAIITADAADIIAIRRGAVGQTFRVYNKDGANFERANFRWASNEFIIDAEFGGTGTALRGIKIGSATSSLLGFYGATPAAQPAAVADATDAATVITQLNALLSRLRTIGLIAT